MAVIDLHDQELQVELLAKLVELYGQPPAERIDRGGRRILQAGWFRAVCVACPAEQELAGVSARVVAPVLYEQGWRVEGEGEDQSLLCRDCSLLDLDEGTVRLIEEEGENDG